MRDEDKGDADLALDALEFDLHGLPKLQVEGCEWLVEQERRRQVDQRTGERNPLLLTTGELSRSACSVVGEAHRLEHLVRPLLDLGLGYPVTPQAERHVVEHRHVGEQGVLLEHRVDLPTVGRHTRLVLTVEEHSTGGRLLEAGDRAQQCGLATSRWAQKRKELTATDAEIGLVYGNEGPELLADPLESDDFFRRTHGRPCGRSQLLNAPDSSGVMSDRELQCGIERFRGATVTRRLQLYPTRRPIACSGGHRPLPGQSARARMSTDDYHTAPAHYRGPP
ncbi:unannotated protein [freshwater metagenome]|uniref:Unannotated protein n=1 Tax=freshwater metagenome TaxID=449393 RepID=A0A6J7EFB5_9ZZZZ